MKTDEIEPELLQIAKAKWAKLYSRNNSSEPHWVSVNEILCWAICHVPEQRKRLWTILLLKGPDKSDFFYLLNHLFNKRFLNWMVLPKMLELKDLAKEDMLFILRSSRINSNSMRELKKLYREKFGEDPPLTIREKIKKSENELVKSKGRKPIYLIKKRDSVMQ